MNIFMVFNSFIGKFRLVMIIDQQNHWHSCEHQQSSAKQGTQNGEQVFFILIK